MNQMVYEGDGVLRPQSPIMNQVEQHHDDKNGHWGAVIMQHQEKV